LQPIRETCRLRPEVLKGDLQDAIFAADFGRVVDGSAPDVYGKAEVFFRNTSPTDSLKKVVETVFGRLASSEESGASLRLSTGFGGGKTHTLIALWHLAKNVADPGLGTALLPAAQRPPRVAVAAIDGDKLGAREAIAHPDVTTHSLWGELAYQLGTYPVMREDDNPQTAPSADRIRAMLPAGVPVLILLDEVVLYMAKLGRETARGLLAFLGALMSAAEARPGTVLVISDPGSQNAFGWESAELAQALAPEVSEFLSRRASDFDPIGTQAPQVIVTRLFEFVSQTAAQQASAEYRQAYQRVRAERADLLPSETITAEYAQRIASCYPFHPRLLDTAQNQLSAMGDFQRSRGTLRLFARLLRDIWESDSKAALVQAGDINWASDRIRADLLARLKRDQFQAAADADVIRHAGQLDEQYGTDFHRRVASALLLESLPLTPGAALDRADLTLATFRPSDVGIEASEAVDRLKSVSWHLYDDDTGRKFQFRYQPNANKIIEERAASIPESDALSAVTATLQGYFAGPSFSLAPWPANARAVPDSARLKLVLAESEKRARSVVEYEDDSDPATPKPRAFRNAILALAPSPDLLAEALQDARRKQAAESLVTEHKPNTPLRRQLDDLLPGLRRRAAFRAARAFSRVVLAGRQTMPLDERYLVREDEVLQAISGQARLNEFLSDQKLIYAPTDSLDTGLLLDHLLPGATPSLDHDGAFSARAVHERALMSERLRLMRDEGPVRGSILKAVAEGLLVVRLPSGDAYDATGRVSGGLGSRTRDGQHLTTLALTDDVLLAPPSAPCVAGWLQVDEAPPAGKTLSIAEAAALKGATVDDILLALAQHRVHAAYDGETRVVDDETLREWHPHRGAERFAHDWDTAIRLAGEQPLLWLELTASSLPAAKSLLLLAPPLGAQSLYWSVELIGDAREGGTLSLQLGNIRVNSSVKPLDLAANLLRNLNEGSTFEARLRLEFATGGLTEAVGRLEQARQGSPDGVTLSAEFALPAEG